MTFNTSDELTEHRDALKGKPLIENISICGGTGCETQGSFDLRKKFKDVLAKNNLKDIDVKRTGCHGFCEQGPLVQFKDILYTHVCLDDVEEIVKSTIKTVINDC